MRHVTSGSSRRHGCVTVSARPKQQDGVARPRRKRPRRCCRWVVLLPALAVLTALGGFALLSMTQEQQAAARTPSSQPPLPPSLPPEQPSLPPEQQSLPPEVEDALTQMRRAFVMHHQNAPQPPSIRMTPFVVLFESSSGSSWLMQELSALPQLCVIGFEPIDNISMASEADHLQRIRWLDTLWRPRPETDASWAEWQAAMRRASVFGQDAAIDRSLRGCRRTEARAFGLKARLSRLLTSTVAMYELVALMYEHQVKVVRLTRRNRIKQALAEYRRLHGGLGQFRLLASSNGSSDGGGGGGGGGGVAETAEVDLPLFERALTAVQRSHRLAETIGEKLSPQETLHLSYEELLDDHPAAMRSIEAFLGVGVGVGGGVGEAVGVVTSGDAADGSSLLSPPSSSPARAEYSKATPDRLCEAVRNYGDLCRKYADTALAEHFDEPCETACTPGAHIEARGVGVGVGVASTGGGGGGGRRSGAPRSGGGGRSRKSSEAARAKLAEGRVAISSKDAQRWRGGAG